jgi:hypothetical protein
LYLLRKAQKSKVDGVGKFREKGTKYGFRVTHISNATKIPFTGRPGVHTGLPKGVALLRHAAVRVGPHGTGGIECHEYNGFGDFTLPLFAYGGRRTCIGGFFCSGGVAKGDLVKPRANFVACIAYDGRARPSGQSLDSFFACLAIGASDGLPVGAIICANGQVLSIAVGGREVGGASIRKTISFVSTIFVFRTVKIPEAFDA